MDEAGTPSGPDILDTMIKEYRDSTPLPDLSEAEWAMAVFNMYRTGAGGRPQLDDAALDALEAVGREWSARTGSSSSQEVPDGLAVAGWLAILFENVKADDA